MTKAAAGSLIIRLLGHFDVQVHGQPLPHLRSKKGPWLLALLALRRGQPVSRTWLAETLWPDSLQAESLRNLRQSLTDLRKALGDQADRLSAPTTRTLMLDLTGAEVDVLAFDAAVSRQDPAELETAIAVYRGPLLEGCSEAWILPEREARQQAYHQALRTLAAHAQSRGERERSLAYLRHAAAVEPLWEEARRDLMRALAESGDLNAALQVYQELVRLLRDADPLAIPDAETSALYQNLRAQARRRASAPTTSAPLSPSASSPSGSLPRPLAELVGREEEVRQVASQLNLARLVTLTGAGGVGKTRLSIAVAEVVMDAYPDGIWFVELVTTSEPKRVAQAFASVLGIQEEPHVDLIQTLQRSLRQKRLLLVLDNCEHVIEACARLAEALLQSCAGLRILATSRQGLGITGEVVWRVPSLATAVGQRLPVEPAALMEMVSNLEAVQLFVERAEAAQKTFQLTRENAEFVAQICQRLDGIPLAIELAAARVKALTVEQIAARLDDRFRLLTHGSRTALPRHQTLRALIDWGYDLLAEPERTLLRCLSVFSGGWTLDAAEQVCSAAGVQVFRSSGIQEMPMPTLGYEVQPIAESDASKPEYLNTRIPEHLNTDEVLDLLTSLVDKSLVVYEAQENLPRYHLLETIRQYARERLQESGQEDACRTRHRDYFLAFAEAIRPKLTGPEQVKMLDLLDREHDNLRAALDFCAGDTEGDAERRGKREEGREEEFNPKSEIQNPKSAEAGLRLSAALQRFWLLRGHLSEGQERFVQALSHPGAQASTSARADALNRAGNLAQYQGDYARAQALHEESLAIRHTLGDQAGIAIALVNLGIVAQYQGDNAQAQTLLEESLAIQRRLDDRAAIANTLGNLGRVAQAQEDYSRAQPLLEESLAMRRELGDQEGIAIALCCLGSVAQQQGDYSQSHSYLVECLALCRSLGEKYVTPYALEGMAALARAQQRTEAAANLYGAANSLRESTGAPLPPADRSENDRNLTLLRGALGGERFDAAFSAGRSMTLEQAIAFAMQNHS